MTWLMILTLVLMPQDEADFGHREGMANLMEWWSDPKLCKEMGIGEALRERLAKELDNLKTTYQVTQSELNQARKRQTEMLFDAKTSKAEVEKYNREHVVMLSDRMQTTNWDARLLVRTLLDADQLALIAKKHPQFFTSRWFKTSKVPIRQGKVILKKK